MISLQPETTAWGAYFPPRHHALYEAMGFTKRWPNFSFEELCCKGTGSLRVHYDTLDNLQRLRTMLGQPIEVYSYYRSPDYNRQVGGAEDSQHLLGRALDTPLLNGNIAGRMKLVHIATLCGFRGFGFYKGFNHIDTGRSRFWFDKHMERFGDEDIKRTEIYPH